MNRATCATSIEISFLRIKPTTGISLISMSVGDRVLIIVHHFPFALATVLGEYNYIAAPEPALGVWFRHFRRIDKGARAYFADRVTNARSGSSMSRMLLNGSCSRRARDSRSCGRLESLALRKSQRAC